MSTWAEGPKWQNPGCPCSNYLLTSVGKRVIQPTSLAVLLPKPYHLGETGWLSVQNAMEHEKTEKLSLIAGVKGGWEWSGEKLQPPGTLKAFHRVLRIPRRQSIFCPLRTCPFGVVWLQLHSSPSLGLDSNMVSGLCLSKLFTRDGGTCQCLPEADETGLRHTLTK